jgi:hypothetical protein
MLLETSVQRTTPSFIVKYKRLLPESKSGQVCGVDSRFYKVAFTVDAHSDDFSVGQLIRDSSRKNDVVML